MENNKPVDQIWIILIVGLAFCDLARLGSVGYDDVDFLGHPAIQQGLSGEAVRHAFTSTTLWHPLTWLSHALDRTVFGAGLAGPHLVNGALHLGSCLLLFGWLRRFVGTTGFALIVTLLFAVHPMRVESVAWLAERKDVLATFFYIGAVYAYSIWTVDVSRRRLFWIAVLATALGALSKPSLMTLPFALLLLDAWPLDRLRGAVRARLLEKWPFFLLSVGTVAVTLVFFAEDTMEISLGLGARISLSIETLYTYTTRTFSPIGLAAFEPVDWTIPGWLLLASAFVIGFITALAIRHRKTLPAFAMGWLWWLALLFPVSGIAAQSDNFAPDRYTYLAHIGLFIAVVSLLEKVMRFLKLPRSVGGTLATVAILALTFLTFQQVTHWKNPETLWRHTLSVTRKNHVAHHQLGVHLLGTKRTEEGLTHLRLAVDAQPGFSVPRGNFALALARAGRADEAIAEFHAAGPDLPQRARFITELEAAFAEAGATDAQKTMLALQLDQSPEAPAPLYRLALIHLNARELPKAISLLRQSLQHAEPGSLLAGRARHALAQAHTVSGAFAEALAEYALAVPLNPDLPVVRQEYAQLLLNAPDPTLRDAPTALALIEPLADSENPRFLRTLVQARTANGLDASAAAEKGLAAISTIRERDPLPAPWTATELDALQNAFETVTLP